MSNQTKKIYIKKARPADSDSDDGVDFSCLEKKPYGSAQTLQKKPDANVATVARVPAKKPAANNDSDDDTPDFSCLAPASKSVTKPATKPATKPTTKPATKPTTNDDPSDDDDCPDFSCLAKPTYNMVEQIKQPTQNDIRIQREEADHAKRDALQRRIDKVQNKISATQQIATINNNAQKYIKSLSLQPQSTSWIHDPEQFDDPVTPETIRISKIFDKLAAIDYPVQRSPKWFQMREASITASDGGCVLGVNSHEPQYKFYIKKILRPPFEGSAACYHGTKLEQIATMVYEYRMNVRVEEFGLVKHPQYHFLAASPDGITCKYKANGTSLTQNVGRMLEIKCPASRQIKDNDPFFEIEYYKVQVLLQLESCDLEECDFWQNKIRHYDTRQEFLDDTHPQESFRSEKTNMEKGCLIQLLPKKSMAIIAEDPMKYNDIVYSESKFLYPPRINMSPSECDDWIADTLNNLNGVLIKNVMDKYQVEDKMICDAIADNKFLVHFAAELDALVTAQLPRGKYAKRRPRIINEFTENYITRLMTPSNPENIKFISYIIEYYIPTRTYKGLNENNDLVQRLIAISDNPDLYAMIDSNKELHFIKRFYQLIKDLEFPKNYCFDRVYYWRFEHTHCVTVKRDREWFKRSLPIFEKTWANITYLKNNPSVSKKVFEYIDSLPNKDVHGHIAKDNDLVMKYIEYACNPPTDKKKLLEYNKKFDL